jgi:hypothetical protein
MSTNKIEKCTVIHWLLLTRNLSRGAVKKFILAFTVILQCVKRLQPFSWVPSIGISATLNGILCTGSGSMFTSATDATQTHRFVFTSVNNYILHSVDGPLC